MGIPTANIDPAPLAATLEGLPNGVYFGWARLETPAGWPEEDGAVHKMVGRLMGGVARGGVAGTAAGDGTIITHCGVSQVMNIGRRPTVSGAGETDVSVEVRKYLNIGIWMVLELILTSHPFMYCWLKGPCHVPVFGGLLRPQDASGGPRIP